ncbi:MAG: hypothetical protein ACP5HM_02505 [Anaerolineae bacterium]
MNSPREAELLDTLFRHGLASYREAQPAAGLKEKLFRKLQRRKDRPRFVLPFVLGTSARPILRHVANTSAYEEFFFPPFEPELFPAMTFLNRHILAMRVF